MIQTEDIHLNASRATLNCGATVSSLRALLTWRISFKIISQGSYQRYSMCASMSTSRICNIISLRTASDIFRGSGVGAMVWSTKNVLAIVLVARKLKVWVYKNLSLAIWKEWAFIENPLNIYIWLRYRDSICVLNTLEESELGKGLLRGQSDHDVASTWSHE